MFYHTVNQLFTREQMELHVVAKNPPDIGTIDIVA